jgi:hypothetical protein
MFRKDMTQVTTQKDDSTVQNRNVPSLTNEQRVEVWREQLVKSMGSHQKLVDAFDTIMTEYFGDNMGHSNGVERIIGVVTSSTSVGFEIRFSIIYGSDLKRLLDAVHKENTYAKGGLNNIAWIEAKDGQVSMQVTTRS